MVKNRNDILQKTQTKIIDSHILKEKKVHPELKHSGAPTATKSNVSEL